MTEYPTRCELSNDLWPHDIMLMRIQMNTAIRDDSNLSIQENEIVLVEVLDSGFLQKRLDLSLAESIEERHLIACLSEPFLLCI